MPTPTDVVKSEAHRLVDKLPEGAGWYELEYAIYVREKIERGRKASREGRTLSHEEVLREFGIAK
ncbi:MAG: hypothetical protein ACKVT1_12395 [Dehalococcoidia bacterium]